MRVTCRDGTEVTQEVGRQKWAPVLPWDLNGQNTSTQTHAHTLTHIDGSNTKWPGCIATYPDPNPILSFPPFLHLSLSLSPHLDPASTHLRSSSRELVRHKNSPTSPVFLRLSRPLWSCHLFPSSSTSLLGIGVPVSWTRLLGRLNTGTSLGPFVLSLFHRS